MLVYPALKIYSSYPCRSNFFLGLYHLHPVISAIGQWLPTASNSLKVGYHLIRSLEHEGIEAQLRDRRRRICWRPLRNPRREQRPKNGKPLARNHRGSPTAPKKRENKISNHLHGSTNMAAAIINKKSYTRKCFLSPRSYLDRFHLQLPREKLTCI